MITKTATAVTAIATNADFMTFVDDMARALVADERGGAPAAFDLEFEKAVVAQARELSRYLLARLERERPELAAALREVIDIMGG